MLKTGPAKDLGNDGMLCPHVEGWTPWLYHAPEDELWRYYRTANALMMRLERMSAAARAKLKQIEIRCPVKGCLLATVYLMHRRPTADELDYRRRDNARRAANGWPVEPSIPWTGQYLYVGRNASGAEVYDILFYGFSNTPRDRARGCTCCRVVYWRAGCRHGTASLERNRIHELFSVADRDHTEKTEEEAIAYLPEHLRPFWGKRVFHPEPGAWHPKKRQRPGHGQHSRPLQASAPVGARQ